MIPPGDKIRQIASYLCIDHCGEGYGRTSPEDGETFIGIPHGWYDQGAESFIEVRKGDRVVRTVNPRDLSEIEFADEEPQP